MCTQACVAIITRLIGHPQCQMLHQFRLSKEADEDWVLDYRVILV